MAGPPDPSALRRAYGVPDAVRLRDDGAEVLAWVDGAVRYRTIGDIGEIGPWQD